jgi:hypothetical protein
MPMESFLWEQREGSTGIRRKYLPVLTRLIIIQRQSLGLEPIW